MVKSHSKTPYELFHKRKPFISFFKPFGCPCTILNTKEYLGKFDSKIQEGYFVGYSTQSKAYRVYNKETKIIEESANVTFNELTSNASGSVPNWMFDIDALTNSLNFQKLTGTGESTEVKKSTNCNTQYVYFPVMTVDPPEFLQESKEEEKGNEQDSQKHPEKESEKESEHQEELHQEQSEDMMPELNDTNLDSNIQVEYHPSSRVQKNHPLDLVIGDVHTPMQTRTKLKSISENINIDENANICLFSCFLTQIEPKKAHDALKDPAWVEAMEEELLQFKL